MAWLLACVATACLTATAQLVPPAGSLDTNFNANLRAFGYVYALGKQADGSSIVGGWFQKLNGVLRQNLARVDSAGNLDPDFAPAVNDAVRAVAVQPDGKILVAGHFTVVNGTNVVRLARITSAGKLDTTFQFGTGADNLVRALVLQPDGKILVAGDFANVQGAAHPALVRLLANGSIDSTFQPGLSAGAQVYALALQPDSRVLIGGWFSSVSGAFKRGLARLNANGTLDSSFTANTGPNDWVTALKLQADGHILVGGSICEINLISRNQLARLNPDGSVDHSFAPGARLNGEVKSIGLDEQGRIVVGGAFDDANGAPSSALARFQPDGRLDPTLMMAPGVNGSVWALCPDSGAWLAGGRFDEINGVCCGSLARVQPDGAPDPSFVITSETYAEVRSLTVESDGRLLVGGRFNLVNGMRRNGIARLQVDGQLDSSFDLGAGIDGNVYCLTRDAKGQLWAGGSFHLADGRQQHSIACLASNGPPVAAFKPFDWLDEVYSVLPLPDGSVLAGGYFWDAGGQYNFLARLKPGGGLDFNLPLGWGANDQVLALYPLPDGRIITGGLFTGVAGAWHKGLARLNANGSLDASFNLDLGDNAEVLCLHSYPGSKVLVGGAFTAYSSTALLRLNSDGSVDSTLNAGSGPDGWVQAVDVQADSKIIVVGEFTRFNGAAAKRIVHLNSNGSVDPNFHAPTDSNWSVLAVAIQPGGRIVVGGRFTWLGNRACTGLARLNPGS